MGSGAILTDDMKRVVREQRLGFVATVCPDGTPNLSPKGTTTVWDDDHLVFADLRSPRTVRNLRQNPAIEVNVVDAVRRKGYRFKGAAQVLTEGPLFDQIVRFYGETVEAAAERIRSIVLVEVTSAAPLTSPAYERGRTEQELSEEWKAYWIALWGGDRRAADPNRTSD